jgi:hypothetical protein
MSRRVRVTLLFLSSLLPLLLSARTGWAQYIYAIRTDGGLEWREHLGCLDGAADWAGATAVGAGWQNFKFVFAGGEGVVYAVQADGTLLWYRHDGRPDGSFIWTGPVVVGSGWQMFTTVLSGGDGIIYGILPDGTLQWYRHRGWRDGSVAWDGPQVVGVGWNSFQAVFAGDGGAIYGILPDGSLDWYRHLGRDSGAFSWSGPVTVDAGGWAAFRQVFAGPGGAIYAIATDGTLSWYHHDGWQDGAAVWQGPVTVGSGWAGFKSVFAAEEPLEGYAFPLSVAPGEIVSFYVSSPHDYVVRYARYQRQGDQNAAIALTGAIPQAALVQRVNAQPWQNGCGWAESFQLQVPAGWSSGIRAAELTDTQGRTHRIPFIVRPDPASPGHFAVIANTNTWNAYNPWGGRDKYTSPPATAVSFLRPSPGSAPIDAGGQNHLTRAELWVLDWLHTTGYRFDSYTDTDFHRGIPNLAAYRGLILQTHPEYWTQPMRDALGAYIDDGGNVLYLAGNGVFELVRMSIDERTLDLFTGGSYPSREPSYFRNLTPQQPERNVLGVAYLGNNWNTFAPFRVLDAAHHLFAGTGVANSGLIGIYGINGGGASGWEMDTSIAGTAPDGTIVTGWLGNDRGIAPANLELLARGTNPGYGADITYYQTPAGGFVFSAGSLSFGGSLVIDPVLQQLVRNVLAEAAGTATGVSRPEPVVAGATLAPAQPNPFSARTTVRYTLSEARQVRLTVYDARGRTVARLVDGSEGPGDHAAIWDGRARGGVRAAAGVYFCTLETDGQRVRSDRLVLTR